MKTINQPQTFKTVIRTYIDYILLGICLSIIILRATFTEGPTVQLASQHFTDTIYRERRENTLLISCDCFGIQEHCHCLTYDIKPYAARNADLANDSLLAGTGELLRS